MPPPTKIYREPYFVGGDMKKYVLEPKSAKSPNMHSIVMAKVLQAVSEEEI